MTRKIGILEGTNPLQNSSQFLLRSLTQTDTNNLYKVLPTDEVTEVTNTLNKLIPGVHIQSLQTNLEGLPVNTLLHHCFCILVTRVSHHCHFLERLEQIVKIIKLKPIQSVFLYEVRNVLSAQQSVLLIQLGQHILLR